jgi:hypothetical protein
MPETTKAARNTGMGIILFGSVWTTLGKDAICLPGMFPIVGHSYGPIRNRSDKLVIQSII